MSLFMLAAIRNQTAIRAAKFVLLLGGATILASCATKQEPQLVSDGAGRESALPWNKQEKWEGQGQLGNMADRFNTR
jgi:hypothetical protein